MANVTIQLDKSVVGYGNQGDVITILQSVITDAMIANGHAHTYAGPITPTPIGLNISRYTVVTATAVPLLGVAGLDEDVFLTAAPAVPTLPTAVGNSSHYVIKNYSGSSITPLTTAAQTIDGSAPAALVTTGILRLASDGANWRTI